MREVFVDTGAWVALALCGDRYHEAAKGVYPDLLHSSQLVTTNLILAEVYILLRKNSDSIASLEFLKSIHASPRITLVRVEEDLEGEAEEILAKFCEHQFSYIDATSFALMRKRKIAEAIAFDRHFSIPGFALIPTLQGI